MSQARRFIPLENVFGIAFSKTYKSLKAREILLVMQPCDCVDFKVSTTVLTNRLIYMHSRQIHVMKRKRTLHYTSCNIHIVFTTNCWRIALCRTPYTKISPITIRCFLIIPNVFSSKFFVCLFTCLTWCCRINTSFCTLRRWGWCFRLASWAARQTHRFSCQRHILFHYTGILAKLNETDGSIVWRKKLTEAPEDSGYTPQLHHISNNNLIVVGVSSQDVFTIFLKL